MTQSLYTSNNQVGDFIHKQRSLTTYSDCTTLSKGGKSVPVSLTVYTGVCVRIFVPVSIFNIETNEHKTQTAD